jgi:hypothetical protein
LPPAQEGRSSTSAPKARLLHHAPPEFPMNSLSPKCSWMYRLVTVSVGLALFLLGVHVGDFWGLLLMIVGLVPTVFGIADVSLMSEIRDERAHRHEQRRVAVVPHERRA